MTRFLLYTLAAFLGAATAAHAAPLLGAIGAVAGWIGSLGAVGQAIIGIGLSVGASLLQKAITGKQQKADTRDPGVNLSIRMGDNQPLSFIAGDYATAGRRKYAGTWGEVDGTPNAYFVDVIELSSLPQSGLNGVWVDDQKVTLLTGEAHGEFGFPVAEYRSGGADYMWVKFYNGSQTSADGYLIDRFGGNADRPFTSAMIGRGVTYAIVTCRYDSDLFSSAPSMLFELGSIPLYDPRKDSSVGGSGAHRWDNPATWEPSNNLPVITYNVIRGVYYGNQWIYGGQNLSAYRLPAANWMAAMNEADALVDDGAGPVPAFRGGYEFRGDERPLDAIEDLRLACNARLAEVGGVFKVSVGAPGSAVYAFSDDDVVITKGQSFSPHGSLDDTVNAVEATYPEPAEKWTMKDAPARYDSALEVLDGNRRLPQGVSFEACPYGGQVQRLMLAMLNDARRFRTHQICLPPDAWPMEPNDVVSWTSVRNGYDNKKFLIVAVAAPMSANVVVSLKEIDPADYDWSAADALPTAVGWIGKIGVPAQVMTGWTVQPATLYDASGAAWRPTIRVSWAGGLEDVERVWVQVRLAASGDVVFDSDSSRYASPYYSLLQPVFQPNTEYEVRGRYVPVSTRPTEWSAWLSVTTPNVLADLDVTLETVGEDVRKRFEELQADLNRSIRRSSELAIALSLQGSVGLLDRQVLRQQSGEALAQIIEEKLVRASEDEALAQTLELVGAEIVDVSASVVEERQARVTADEAIAQQTSSVTALLNENFAAGQVKFAATANQSGVNARFSVLLRAGTGSGYHESGLYLEIYTEGGVQRSRFAVNADQFVVLNNGQRPFLFEGGVLKLNASHIGTIVAGLLLGSSGKTRLDLDNDYLSVSD
ncbi:MAG: hypothetical protein CMH13_08790 [Martelella sp.]|uniref:phage tail protein n=1 Tax=unclassified Martelella TaxID=2629616 RepID=UPI000C36ADCF|nr:phage tail protein [Martelella sp.]MAU20615.1 hypothetical protein [Martelella sp.]